MINSTKTYEEKRLLTLLIMSWKKREKNGIENRNRDKTIT